MYDSLAAKAARFQIAHEPDCGKCANCLEVQALQQEYAHIKSEPDSVIREMGMSLWKAYCSVARHAWLEGSRLKRCTGGVK